MPLIGIPDLSGGLVNLAEALAPTNHDIRFHFVDEQHTVTLGDVCKRGQAVAVWAGGPGEAVATVLSNTSSCAAVLIGAIQCGVELISVPPPPRGADFDWYSHFVRDSCIQRGVNRLIVDDDYIPLLPEIGGVSYFSYNDVLATSGYRDTDPTMFRLVQYTSGSTSDPRGVVLDQSQILANIQSILDRIQPEPGDAPCSWLPLSHDMGLIGMFLSSIVGATTHTNGADIAILTPEGFLRNPGAWLRVCSEYGSTITAAPNFGFDMALRRQSSGAVDLAALRICITGAEPVHAATLEKFAEVFAPSGFSSKAHCPAYGLAEATLAVTMNSPHEQWSGIVMDPDDLMEGRVTPNPAGVCVVGAGRALEGVELSVESSDGGIGEILIRGPSVLKTYSDGTPATDIDGWFRTCDLGFLESGQLFVVGRKDDVLFAAGRNIFAVDVERHVGQLPGIRAGKVIALTTGGDSFTILVEAEDDAADLGGDYSQLVSAVQKRVTSRTGISPRAVGVVGRGRLPMTASGKTRRPLAEASLDDETLELLKGSIGFDSLP